MAAPTPLPPAVGYLVAVSRPWAKVFVDHRDTGKRTPIPPRGRLRLSPGRHTVTLVTNSGSSFDFAVRIVAGETYRIDETLQ